MQVYNFCTSLLCCSKKHMLSSGIVKNINSIDSAMFSCFDPTELENNNIHWKNTIPFIPPINKGYVIKVYDGDTITIASKINVNNVINMYRFSVRLNGIDCPEIKGKTDTEKQCAILAKEEMHKLVFGKIVYLKNVKMEKYGRLLADVYVNDVHINQYMLDKKLAVPYEGKTKMSPPDWIQYHNDNDNMFNV